MSGLRIDVAELIGRPGASKEISRSEPLSGLRMPLGWVEEDEPVELSLWAESVLEGVEVSGSIAGTLHMHCSRCLIEYEERFDHEVRETFYSSKRDDEEYEVSSGTIDLEPMIRDLIVLNIPPQPLHDSSCKGLCPVCGADRNETDCGHTQDLSDMRWAPLRALLPKEVND